MLKVIWRYPLWGSGEPAVSQTAESWVWPVGAYQFPSTHTVVQDPVDIVEFGHKEVVS